MNIGEKIKQIRLENGLTQEELANKLHLSRQAITAWESGRCKPDINTLNEISKLFNLNIEDLISQDSKGSNRKCHYIKYLIISIAIILTLAGLIAGITFTMIYLDEKNTRDNYYPTIGTYLSFDEELVVESLDSLSGYNIPYLINYKENIYSNYFRFDNDTYLASIPKDAYEECYVYYLYYNEYKKDLRVELKKILNSENLFYGCDFSIDEFVFYELKNPNDIIAINSYDKDNNLIKEETFYSTDEGIVMDNGDKLDGYLDVYQVEGAHYYNVTLICDNDYKKYNVIRTESIFTNLAQSNDKLYKYLETKFIIE